MNFKRFIALAACLATVLTVTVACTKDDVDDVTVYETDMWGEKVTDKDGNNVTVPIEGASIEYVTDEDGNKILDKNGERITILHYYVNEVDDNGNIVTNKNNEKVTKVYSSTPSTTSSSGSISGILSGETEMTTAQIVTMPEGTTISTSKRLYDKNYHDIISTGNFYIEMKMTGNTEGMGFSTGVAFAMSGDKIYSKMNVNISIINLTLENIFKDGKSYTIYPKKKIYTQSQSDEMLDTSEIKEMLGSDNAVYQKTSVVTSKGTTYICEEYLIDNVTYKYYFDQKTEVLKRIEYEAGDGNAVVMDINKITKNPSASYFEIPSGYKQVSEDEFTNALTGGLSSILSTTASSK